MVFISLRAEIIRKSRLSEPFTIAILRLDELSYVASADFSKPHIREIRTPIPRVWKVSLVDGSSN